MTTDITTERSSERTTIVKGLVSNAVRNLVKAGFNLPITVIASDCNGDPERATAVVTDLSMPLGLELKVSAGEHVYIEIAIRDRNGKVFRGEVRRKQRRGNYLLELTGKRKQRNTKVECPQCSKKWKVPIYEGDGQRVFVCDCGANLTAIEKKKTSRGEITNVRISNVRIESGPQFTDFRPAGMSRQCICKECHKSFIHDVEGEDFPATVLCPTCGNPVSTE